MKVKPFARSGNFTKIDNALLDYIMPAMSANAWKTLCYIIRQTAGQQLEEAQLTYNAIKKGTGIHSDATLRKSVLELICAGLITATSKKEDEGNYYSLNRSLEIEVPNNLSKTEVRPGVGTSENEEHIKENTLPNGSGVAHLTDVSSVPLAAVFRQYLEELRLAKNKSAMIRTLIVALYGEVDAPDFGYIGKVAKKLDSWGYLAARLWELSARPVNGDPLAYLLAEHNGKASRKVYTNGNSAASSVSWEAVLDTQLPEYLQEVGA